MFDEWRDDPEYPTLYRIDRDVIVDIARLFPASGVRRDELPVKLRTAPRAVDAGASAWLGPPRGRRLVSDRRHAREQCERSLNSQHAVVAPA
jgi:hypothetical protein